MAPTTRLTLKGTLPSEVQRWREGQNGANCLQMGSG